MNPCQKPRCEACGSDIPPHRESNVCLCCVFAHSFAERLRELIVQPQYQPSANEPRP